MNDEKTLARVVSLTCRWAWGSTAFTDGGLLVKIDLRKFAVASAEFGNMPSKSEGLAALFRIVEREAFCDGVRAGRISSYAVDPSALHDEYEAVSAPKLPPRKRRKPFTRPVPAQAADQSPAANAVDPSAQLPGTPTPRDTSSSSSSICDPKPEPKP